MRLEASLDPLAQVLGGAGWERLPVAPQPADSTRIVRGLGRIVLELTNDMLFAFPVGAIAALARATDAQLGEVRLDGSGSVLMWEGLDVDLSVPGLILSAVEPGERRRHLARMAGRVRSQAKARAARVNGRKGGRPRTRRG